MMNYTRFKIDNDDTLENPAFRGENLMQWLLIRLIVRNGVPTHHF